MAKKDTKITKHCKVCGTGAIKGAIECISCGAELKTSLGMRKVYPIEKDQVALIRKSINVGTYGSRNEFLFLIMMNTALRISDVLKIKVGMIRGKEYLELIEQKTEKEKRFVINSFLKQIVDEYTKDMKDDEYLFQSRKNLNGESKPISRIQAHKILSDATLEIGIKGFSNHSCRKTYARLIYEKTGDISFVMRLLNHSSEKMTLKYLHLTEEKDNEIIMDFSLF